MTRTWLAILALALTTPANARELSAVEAHAVSLGADPQLVEKLGHIEELAGVPDRLRGMLIAKAWFESKFNPRARGDRRGRVYKAHGLLQLWPWALQSIRDRDDPVAAGHAFLGAIVSSLIHLRRRCPRVRDEWRLAWIRVNRGPRWRRPDRAGEPRCTGTDPAGMKVLRRWRKKVRAPTRR